MKTLTLKTNLTKVALLGALTIAPALAWTSSAQASPSHRGNSVPAWNNSRPTWNNNLRHEDSRFDSRNKPEPRFNSHSAAGRIEDHRGNLYRNGSNRNDGRFDNNGRFNSRHDYDRKHDDGNGNDNREDHRSGHR
ncbi:hypothetical protein IAD21_03744 [Abditibacteriota bacterium]|nr:hypothetical protein IAD21_03744 [Abditibacteriota bacterium]